MFVINFVINRAEKNIREDKRDTGRKTRIFNEKKDWVFTWLPITTFVILDILYEHLKDKLKDKLKTLKNGKRK